MTNPMPEPTTATVIRKIPGGKLVRMEITHTEPPGRIIQAKITGDFFLHPEETLELLTEVIQAATLPLDPVALQAQLETVLAENNAQAIGFQPADLVSMLEEALA